MLKGKSKTGRMCAAALAAILVLTGCGHKNPVVNYPESNKNITSITFFGNKYEPENVAVIEDIISDFMEENPDIRVSYESLKGTEYFEALDKRMAAGRGDDVFMVNHDITLKLMGEGMLADLSGMKTIPAYMDSILSQMEESDGSIYWVPTTVSVFGLYCNLDLLKEHGQEVPQNLDQWESVCGYFKGQGIVPIIANNDISLKTLAIGTGFFPAYRDQLQRDAFERLNGGSEKLSQYLRPGFEVAKELIDRGYIDADKALNTNKTSDDLNEFMDGGSPFMLTGAWAAGRVAGMQPDFAFEVVPYPALKDGSYLVINADTRLSVNAGSEHTDAAVRFVEFFTQRENIQKFADEQSSFSPLNGGTPSALKEIRPLIPCYEAGRTVIGTDSLLDLPIWNLTAEVSKRLLSGEQLETALAWMDEQSVKGW